MAYYHLCLFLFLSLLFSLTQQQPQVTPPPHSYVFAVQWPNSYCNAPPRASHPCAHPIPQRFTIHGLWPDNAVGKPMPPWPGAAVLNYAAVSQYTFLADLITHWPDLNGNHFMFWKHEWDTHGTGSGETPENFFLKAIDLIKEINGRMDSSIVNRFIHKNLNPGPGKVYKPTEFPSVVFKFTNVVAKISCNFDTAQKNQLHEIHLCLDRPGILINCTHQVVQQKIVYPIDQRMQSDQYCIPLRQFHDWQ